MIHAANTTETKWPSRAISAGLRKIPVPIMVPTTMAPEAHAPRPRTRSSRFPFRVSVRVSGKVPRYSTLLILLSCGLGRWRKAADNRADEKGDACANQEIPREGDARKPPYGQNYRESREHADERATRIGGAIQSAQKKQAQQATER